MPLPSGLDEDSLSRILNAYFGGDPGELFSARCHRPRWRSLKWAILRLIVDNHFRRARGESGHCRAAYLREQTERIGESGSAQVGADALITHFLEVRSRKLG